MKGSIILSSTTNRCRADDAFLMLFQKLVHVLWLFQRSLLVRSSKLKVEKLRHDASDMYECSNSFIEHARRRRPPPTTYKMNGDPLSVKKEELALPNLIAWPTFPFFSHVRCWRHRPSPALQQPYTGNKLGRIDFLHRIHTLINKKVACYRSMFLRRCQTLPHNHPYTISNTFISPLQNSLACCFACVFTYVFRFVIGRLPSTHEIVHITPDDEFSTSTSNHLEAPREYARILLSSFSAFEMVKHNVITGKIIYRFVAINTR